MLSLSRFSIAAAALFASGLSNSAVIVDTGTPSGSPMWSLDPGQWFAGEFEIAAPYRIESVQGYYALYMDSGLVISLHSDGGDIPGLVLQSKSLTTGAVPLGWKGIDGLAWDVLPGSYWISFMPADLTRGIMPGLAPSPLNEYAQGSYTGFNNYGPNRYDYLDIGLRIEASPPVPATAVPLPGTALLFVAGALGLLGVRTLPARRRAPETSVLGSRIPLA